MGNAAGRTITGPRAKTILVWFLALAAALVPVSIAAMSPLLEWREPTYIAAGMAGVLSLAVLLMQPLLASGRLPGLSPGQSRYIHRWLGSGLVLLVVVHVVGLWVTSPPDVIDALTFASPTPFSVWGVTAMWAVLATALLVALRRWLRLSPRAFQRGHMGLAAVVVTGTIVHAWLIDGTMGTVSKAGLCALVALATVGVIADRFRFSRRRRLRGSLRAAKE
ncbi:ferric reductase-like transmembrane domain-containing protein [Rhizobiaceae bacterium]|nr:ferric reductase-like transmembrane domain-containing protein [Rhizobiaceae bacterium]